MLHNETDFPEPESFNPDRFLKDGKLNPDVRSPESTAFGFGPRYVTLGFLSEAPAEKPELESVLGGTLPCSLCL
jgi:hypothetical protein